MHTPRQPTWGAGLSHAGGVTDPRAPQAQRRWTISRSANALHRQVLQPADYERRGTTCLRTDFLVREVTFQAARFMEPEERTLVVGFNLSWAELAAADAPRSGYSQVGGDLRDAFPQPWSTEKTLSPLLLAEVATTVLDYLEAPSSPSQFVDQLLSYREQERTDYVVPYSESVHSYCAAWGALLLGDAERCQQALTQARRLTLEGPDGQNEEWLKRTLEWHREEIALIDAAWATRFDVARPLPA